ncbi:MAG: hypothetical protein ACT4PE_02950 [Candidatus Eiseniibacteriota bacterium]
MEESRAVPSRGPLVLSVIAGALMVWLAGGPFEPRGALVAPGGQPAMLIEPRPGPSPGFPRRFSWTPVAGADEYVVTVGPAGGAILFRQRGETTELELSVDAGADPPPGDYLWEVAAFAQGRPLGTATGTFTVRAP